MLSETPWTLKPLGESSVQTSEPEPVGPSVEERIRAAAAEAEERGRAQGRATAEAEHQARVRELEQQCEQRVEAARRESRGDVESAVRVFAEATREVRAVGPVWLESLEDNVLALAITAAERVIGEQAELDPDQVRGVVREAIAALGPAEPPIRVRMNPADLDAVGEIGAGVDVTWVPDDRVGRGGCVVEATDRLVDADVESSLAKLYRAAANG
jgi:flagellar biosynthesis/type III secretory pathway protein FliH